jgi:hypothetical protein
MAPHQHIEIEHAVPEIEEAARFRKWVTVLVGLAAASASVLAYAETQSNREKEHAFTTAARTAEQIFVGLGASANPEQFEGNAARAALAIGQQGNARVLGTTPGQPFDFALAVNHADERVSARLIQVAKQMATIPPNAPGLDKRTAEAVRSSPGTLGGTLLGKQQQAVEDADRWATRQEHTIFALGLVAIAAALGGLAGLMGFGRPGVVAASTGSLALVVAVVWSGITFLT